MMNNSDGDYYGEFSLNDDYGISESLMNESYDAGMDVTEFLEFNTGSNNEEMMKNYGNGNLVVPEFRVLENDCNNEEREDFNEFGKGNYDDNDDFGYYESNDNRGDFVDLKGNSASDFFPFFMDEEENVDEVMKGLVKEWVMESKEEVNEKKMMLKNIDVYENDDYCKTSSPSRRNDFSNCYIAPPPPPPPQNESQKEYPFLGLSDSKLSFAQFFSQFAQPLKIGILKGKRTVNIFEFQKEKTCHLPSFYDKIVVERTDGKKKCLMKFDFSAILDDPKYQIREVMESHKMFVFAREFYTSYNNEKFKKMKKKNNYDGKKFTCSINEKDHLCSHERFIYQNYKMMEIVERIENKEKGEIVFEFKMDNLYKNIEKCNVLKRDNPEKFTLKKKKTILEVCVILESRNMIVPFTFLFQYYGGDSRPKNSQFQSNRERTGLKFIHIPSFVIQKDERIRVKLLEHFERGIEKEFGGRNGENVENSWFEEKLDHSKYHMRHTTKRKRTPMTNLVYKDIDDDPNFERRKRRKCN